MGEARDGTTAVREQNTCRDNHGRGGKQPPGVKARGKENRAMIEDRHGRLKYGVGKKERAVKGGVKASQEPEKGNSQSGDFTSGVKEQPKVVLKSRK